MFFAKLCFVQNEPPGNTQYAAPNLKENVESSLDFVSPTPDNPPWNSWAALGVWVASIVFIALFPILFLFPYLINQNINLADRDLIAATATTDPTAVLLQVIAVIPAHLFTLLLAWLVVTRFRRFSFRETLGWKWNGFGIWNCLIILGGFYILAGVVSYFLPEQENDMLRILQSSRNAVYIVAFLATFTAPLIEEVVYRGILYSAFQRSLGVLAAILITTFLFALVHVPQYWGSPGTIFVICLLSLTLTLIRFRTKNLLPCIALHTAINGSQSLLLLLQPILQEYVEKHQPKSAALIHFFN